MANSRENIRGQMAQERSLGETNIVRKCLLEIIWNNTESVLDENKVGQKEGRESSEELLKILAIVVAYFQREVYGIAKWKKVSK